MAQPPCARPIPLRGKDHQLALDEPELGNAIHGLVRWANWEVLEQRGDRVVVSHLQHPRPGYPFTLELIIQYRLAADGLTVITTARNVGERPPALRARISPLPERRHRLR